MSGDEEASPREKMITALLEGLDEELTDLATDITRLRDSVRVVSTLWRSENDPMAGLAEAMPGSPKTAR
jgi:hypothetical protein